MAIFDRLPGSYLIRLLNFCRFDHQEAAAPAQPKLSGPLAVQGVEAMWTPDFTGSLPW